MRGLNGRQAPLCRGGWLRSTIGGLERATKEDYRLNWPTTEIGRFLPSTASFA